MDNEQGNADRRDAEVVIVGGGPVGLGLAIELGQRGVRTTQVERYPQPQPIPKGQNLTQRTMEHFQFWGVVDEIRAARTAPEGFPIGEVTFFRSLSSDYWHAPPWRWDAIRSAAITTIMRTRYWPHCFA